MKTQSPIFRNSLYSSVPSTQIPPNYLFSNLSKIRSPKRVSLKSHYSPFSPALLAESKARPPMDPSSTEVFKVWWARASSPANGSSGRDGKKKVECKGVFDIENYKIRRKNLAVFVSGGGSNFRSIHEATLNGSVHGDVVVLVTNKKDCGGAEYALDNHIPLIVFPRKKDEQKSFSAEDLVNTLRFYKVDFILLAGYLKLIPVELVRAYPKSILNIHPSLLPAFGGKGFYGMKVHKSVISSGARYSGPTIHYVDEEYDTGRTLAQRVVPVHANDTAEELAARVLHEEHKLYVDVAAALCEDRIMWREDGVPLIHDKENPSDYL